MKRNIKKLRPDASATGRERWDKSEKAPEPKSKSRKKKKKDA